MNKALIIILFSVFIGCNKDERLFIPDNTFIVNQEVLLKQIVETPVSYKVNIVKEKYLFFGPNGSIIEIPSNSFSYFDGNSVYGEIKIEFLEFTQQKASMLFGPSSGFQNSSFDARKQVFIRFSKDDKELVLKSGIKIFLSQDQESNKNRLSLLVYNKNQIENTGWSIESEANEILKIQDWEISYKDNLILRKGYKIDVSNNIHWYSIGSFEESMNSQNVNICVKTGKEFNSKNSLVYFVSSNKNTIIKINHIIGPNWEFCQSDMLLPKDLKGSFIVISYLGNDSYYFGMTNAVITNETHIEVDSEKKTLQEIREILSSL